MGESAGSMKLRVPWARDDLITKPQTPIWGALDVVNRQYVKALVEDATGLVFIGPNPPPNPLPGKLWWRNDPDATLYIYYDDGTSEQWVPATPGGGGTAVRDAVTTIGPNPPANPEDGRLWLRTDPDFKLYVWYNDGTTSQWVGVQ